MSTDKNKDSGHNDNIEVNHSKSTLSAVDPGFERSLSAHKPAEMPVSLYRSILNETVNKGIAIQQNNGTTVKSVSAPLWKQYARAAVIGIVCGLAGLLVGRMSVDTQEAAPSLTTSTGVKDNSDNDSYFDDTNTSTVNIDYLIRSNQVSRQPYSRAAYLNATQSDRLDEQLERSAYALQTSMNNNHNNTFNITRTSRRELFGYTNAAGNSTW